MINTYTNTEAAINDFGEEILALYKKELSDAGYSTGKLYKTIKFKVKAKNGNYLIELNLENYWKYIEYGRKKGAKMPPISAIEKWITRRNIVPRPQTLANGKKKVPSTPQLAFLIARSISKKGIKARPFLSKSVEAAQEKHIKLIEAAIIKDLNAELAQEFNDNK